MSDLAADIDVVIDHVLEPVARPRDHPAVRPSEGQPVVRIALDREPALMHEPVVVGAEQHQIAGFGFAMAIKALRPRLVKGESIELGAVGFTPRPRLASVELSYGGVDELRMAGRQLRGDRFIIHPKLPWYAKLFVKIPDTHIWLTTPTPAGFLRMEGPLAEPDDAPVRIDLLPGAGSA